MHVVYCVDVGDRMSPRNLLPMVRQALDRALSELKTTDTFTFVVFAAEAEAFSMRLLPPLPHNVESALGFVTGADTGASGANYSAAIELAVAILGTTHIYILSSGGPVGGIENPDSLRAHIRSKNQHGVKISCITVGEDDCDAAFLMRGIAADNGGTYFRMETDQEHDRSRTLLVATTNVKKGVEMVQILGAANLSVRIITLADIEGAVAVEEIGDTFLANARLKAHAAVQSSGLTSIADDGGLVIDALGGAPGVHSHRFCGEHTSFYEKMDRILDMLRDTRKEQRGCRFVSTVVLATPEGAYYESVGTCEGTIALEKRGANGFGYDPIFLLPDGVRHMAELTPDEKHRISHRGAALAGILPHLRDVFGQAQ